MVKELSSGTWEQEVSHAEKPVVVDFWHEQCVWCLRLSPVYEELSSEYDEAVLAKIDIRSSPENMGVAQKYGIMGTPTMKVFCEGQEVGEIVGYMEKDVLKQEIDKIISGAENCKNQSSPL